MLKGVGQLHRDGVAGMDPLFQNYLAGFLISQPERHHRLTSEHRQRRPKGEQD
jgi:hypothetical protein